MRRLTAALATLTATLTATVVLTATPAHAGGVGCGPGGANVRPWTHMLQGGVIRGAGTLCGDPQTATNWEAYAWDERADGACMFIVYSPLYTSGFVMVEDTYVCGYGNINWDLNVGVTADQIKLVVDYGGGTTYSTIIWPTPPPW